ncbi:MAG: GTPase HflX, partial [Candidatus Brocadiia bacterium]
VIFDNNLSPKQIAHLEKIAKTRVIDRSQLILDIFATRAQTRQAKLQVSLAQLEYTYPRLTRMWSHLDSVAGAGGATAAGAVGGIGTRGTGEQQLEIDRRIVSRKIADLKEQLAEIDKRKMREIEGREGVFKACLVGYTNAGKSSVLNALTDADVFVEDMLFATLDTRTKKWVPEKGVEILLSDTVGFVRNLPHQLVASFKATLEEAINADLLVHIIDVSNPEALKQIDSVNRVLREIKCGGKPIQLVFNKIDVLKSMSQLDMLQTMYPDALCVSAKTGLGLAELCQVVSARCKGSMLLLRVQNSHSNGKVQSFLRAKGTIVTEQYLDNGVLIEVRLGKSHLHELQRLHPDALEIIN